MKVFLKNYRIDCTIGINQEELYSKQSIFIDLELIYDAKQAIEKDSIEYAINYVEVGNLCNEVAQAKHYFLLETLCFDILEKLFEHYPAIQAKVTIKKPNAIKEAEYAAVEGEKTSSYHRCS